MQPTIVGSGCEASADNTHFRSGMPREDIARRNEHNGRCIRHASLRAAFPVFALTVAMVKTTLGAVLMATVSTPPLFANGRQTTARTAITLTAITGATDTENRIAPTACSLPKNNLALLRHPRPSGGAGQGRRFMAGLGSSGAYLMATHKVAKLGSRRWKRRDPRVVFPPFQTTYITAPVWG